jgi:hypothetical protein
VSDPYGLTQIYSDQAATDENGLPALPPAFLPDPDLRELEGEAGAGGPAATPLVLAPLISALTVEGLLHKSLKDLPELQRSSLIDDLSRKPSALDAILSPPKNLSQKVDVLAQRRRASPLTGSPLAAINALLKVPALQEAKRNGDVDAYNAVRDRLLFETSLLAGLDMLGAADEASAATRAIPARVRAKGLAGLKPGLRGVAHGLIRRPATAVGSLALLSLLTQMASPE